MEILSGNSQSQFNVLNSMLSRKNNSVMFKAANNLNLLNRLYSDEFLPKREINEDGYTVTTVLNNLTNKPEEIYILKDQPECNEKEVYRFYEKTDDGYEEIGSNSFCNDEKSKNIIHGYMQSDRRKKYAGVGSRAHHLTIEEMFRKGYQNVLILSLGSAFPFHYKSGFRPIEQVNEPILIDNSTKDKIITDWAIKYGTTDKIMSDCIDMKDCNGTFVINPNKTKANIALYFYQNNLDLPKTINPYMELTHDSKKEWAQRINTQPLLGKERISFQSNKSRINNDESATLDTLFLDKYRISPELNKDGYYRTTIIDKKKNRPTIVYIKKEEGYSKDFEVYKFYKKTSIKKYKEIASRSFGIDKDKKLITSGYMESFENSRYAGLGIRGHQLAVERMMQEGLDNVEILSLPEAFKFHYKCGFRHTNRTDCYERFDDMSLDEIIDYYSSSWKVNKNDIKINISYEKLGEKILVHLDKTAGQLFEYLYVKGEPIPYAANSPALQLSKDNLKIWKQRAKMQPIFP